MSGGAATAFVVTPFAPNCSCMVSMNIPGYYEIQPDSFGFGANGVVCTALDTRSGQSVAVKKIPDAWTDPEQSKRVLREIKYQSRLQHPNISAITDVLLGRDDSLYVVQELLTTDLQWVIQSQQPLTQPHILQLAYNLFDALEYIHSVGVVHRDLKPVNCLVTPKCDLRLCDFGLCRVISNVHEIEPEVPTEYVTSRWYRAPEVLLGSRYDAKVDIWAAGCIFAELLQRKPLFVGGDPQSQLDKIINVVGAPSQKFIKQIPMAPQRAFLAQRVRPVPVEPLTSTYLTVAYQLSSLHFTHLTSPHTCIHVAAQCMKRRRRWVDVLLATVAPHSLLVPTPYGAHPSQLPNQDVGPIDRPCTDVLTMSLEFNPHQRSSASEVMRAECFNGFTLAECRPHEPPLFSNDWEEKLNFKDPKAVELAILDEMRRLNSHKDSEVDIQPSPS